MNPQVDKTSGLGLPQPGSDTSQLPSIHAPQNFHAPDNAAPQFGVSSSAVMPAAPVAAAMPAQPLAPPVAAIAPQPAAGRTVLNDPIAAANAQFAANSAMAANQSDDADAPFDEEWVSKAKEIVGRTHTDPYAQSKDLSKLKAQYIKARYNKDIKVSE